MNGRAICVLWLGIAVIVAMGLYPPWAICHSSTTKWSDGKQEGYTAVFFYGYRFLFDPPTTGSGFVDLSRLTVQWVIVAVITLGVVLTVNRCCNTRTAKDPIG